MSDLEKIKNVNKIITDKFPKLNNQYIIESSIESTYSEVFFPINEFKQDSYIEFRVPKSTSVYTALSSIYLKFHLNVFKQGSVNGRWGLKKALGVGDHLDLIQNTAYSIIKLLTLDINNVQIQNIDNYALNAYIKTLINFPIDQYSKLAHLIHLEDYNKIIEKYKESDFENLDDANAKRLLDIRQYGVYIYAPVLLDISKIKSLLIDGLDFIFRFTLHDAAFIVNTAQNNTDISGTAGKRYLPELENVSLHMSRFQPSKNAHNALQSSLLPRNNQVPTLEYPFISQINKQYYIPHGRDTFVIENPWGDKIPDRIFLAFQKTEAFNTRDHTLNGLFLAHLNIKNFYITINSNTIFNINCDFANKSVSEVYHELLAAIGDDSHLITFNKFLDGATLFGFNLIYKDSSTNISPSIKGTLRIVLTFSEPVSTSSMLYLLGDHLSILTVNHNRELVLNTS